MNREPDPPLEPAGSTETTTPPADLKSIVSEIKRLGTEADALRDAKVPWPEQRSAYEKVIQAVIAYIIASPFDNPKLSQWTNYKAGLDNFMAQADGEYSKVAKKLAWEAKRAQAAVAAEASQIDEEVTPEDWKGAVALDRKNIPLSVPYNAALFLRFHPELKGMIRWDTFAKHVEVRSGAIRNLIKQEDPNLEAIVVAVEDWMYKEVSLSINHGDLKRRVVATALRHQYSSLAEHLLSFQWDGVERIDRFLIDRCGARTVSKNGEDITEHVLRISRRFFISAVARGLDPGCQVDTVLVLEGSAGLRKTSVFRVIGGAFACETELAIGGNKDSNQLASTRWIIELAELDSLRNREHTTINAFLTKRSDYYRPPYAAEHESFPRSCVFVGTTNKEEWIEDSTGDRRFWPVYVTKIDLPAIEAERDQLIAEAVHCFLNGGQDKCGTCVASYRGGGEKRCGGHRWWLDLREQKMADGVTAERVTEVPFAGRIVGFLRHQVRASKEVRVVDPENFTIAELAEHALKLPPDKWESVSSKIGKVLKALKCKDSRPRVSRHLQVHYFSLNEEVLKQFKESPSEG